MKHLALRTGILIHVICIYVGGFSFTTSALLLVAKVISPLCQISRNPVRSQIFGHAMARATLQQHQWSDQHGKTYGCSGMEELQCV